MTIMLRKCNSKDCTNDASHFIVWTDPMLVCEDCARRLIGVGQAMGFPTPERTVRPAYPFELLINTEEAEGESEEDDL